MGETPHGDGEGYPENSADKNFAQELRVELLKTHALDQLKAHLRDSESGLSSIQNAIAQLEQAIADESVLAQNELIETTLRAMRKDAENIREVIDQLRKDIDELSGSAD